MKRAIRNLIKVLISPFTIIFQLFVLLVICADEFKMWLYEEKKKNPLYHAVSKDVNREVIGDMKKFWITWD